MSRAATSWKRGQADGQKLSSDERGHAAVVRAAAEGGRVAATIGSDIARAEPWHRSFALFAVGAIVPVLAFMIAHGPYATVVSTGLSAVALAAIGIVTSLFNGRAALVLRQVVFGFLAAGVAYGIGMLLGVSKLDRPLRTKRTWA